MDIVAFSLSLSLRCTSLSIWHVSFFRPFLFLASWTHCVRISKNDMLLSSAGVSSFIKMIFQCTESPKISLITLLYASKIYPYCCRQLWLCYFPLLYNTPTVRFILVLYFLFSPCILLGFLLVTDQPYNDSFSKSADYHPSQKDMLSYFLFSHADFFSKYCHNWPPF